MQHEDILHRLRLDAGQRTIGALMQEREAAPQEITRLRSEIERLRCIPRRPSPDVGAAESERHYRPGMLVRLNELCEMIGVGRSTIYKWVNEGTFPQPVRISERAVRWRIDEIEAWRDALG